MRKRAGNTVAFPAFRPHRITGESRIYGLQVRLRHSLPEERELEVEKYFSALGSRLHREWKRRDFEELSFPALASEALEKFLPAKNLAYCDIARWFLSEAIIPAQHTIPFGQPAAVVYRSPRFLIEVLFWLDGTTAIHEHGFSGAFSVLAGSSLHSQWAFRESHRINAHFRIGRIDRRGSEVLSAGDCRPIVPGGRFIHSLFHLDVPSVTVVVRSDRDSASRVQLEFLRPFVARDSSFNDIEARRRIEVALMLLKINSRDANSETLRLAGTLDIPALFDLLRELFFLKGREQLFERCLDVARKRMGRYASVIRPVLEETARVGFLAAQRAVVSDHDHRFLLALLMNLPDRSSILEVIRSQYGGDARERLRGWIRKLAAHQGAFPEQGNVFGTSADEATIDVLAALVHDPSDRAVAAALRRVYSAESVRRESPRIRRLCRELREAAVLKPLFR